METVADVAAAAAAAAAAGVEEEDGLANCTTSRK